MPIQIYSDRAEGKTKLKVSSKGAPLRFANAVAVTGSLTRVTAASRLRSFALSGVRPKSHASADGELRIVCPPAIARSASRIQLTYFVNAAPIAPPVGYLSLANLATAIDDDAPPDGFSGERLILGDTIPVFFKITGQKLINLRATFTAKQKNVPVGQTPLTLSKSNPGAIVQTAPAVDPITGIQSITGNLILSGNDTASFPDDRELEFAYTFVMSDGVGRTYTIDRGMFTLYPAL